MLSQQKILVLILKMILGREKININNKSSKEGKFKE
jgi:hypothetical protein